MTTIRIDREGNRLEYFPPKQERLEEKARLAQINDNNNVIMGQIINLENSVTQRRIRESLLTEDGKMWLFNIEEQIEKLRLSLISF